MLDNQEIEKSIIKKYRKSIWSKFMKAVSDYELIQENDNIMVCISGGKDSFLLAKCIQELERHGKVSFKAHYVCMNPGYSKKNLELIKKNAHHLKIPLEIFTSDIFASVDKVGGKSPCYLCARMRRGYLYNHALEIGCNKIALGHHFDDVIETTLLSILYGAEIKTMLPKLKSTNYPNLELIRPLYLVKEKSIINFKNNANLTFLNCACRFTEKEANYDKTGKRLEMKQLINQLRETYNEIDNNIFKSMSNVNINCVLGYSKDGKKHNFLDEY